MGGTREKVMALTGRLLLLPCVEPRPEPQSEIRLLWPQSWQQQTSVPDSTDLEFTSVQMLTGAGFIKSRFTG